MSEQQENQEVEEVVLPTREQLMGEEVEEERAEVKDVEDNNERSEVEKRAMEQGWSPEGVPGKRHKSAEEFLEYGELKSTISSLKKQTKKYSDIQGAQKEYIKILQQKVLNREKNELESKKKEAFEEQDYDTFNQAESEIKALEEELALPGDDTDDIEGDDTVVPNIEITDEMVDWQKRNSWFENDEDMATFAMATMLKIDPKLPPIERLKKLEARVKQAFPHKFRNQNNFKPSAVDSNDGVVAEGGNNKKIYKWEDVPENIRKIGRTLVKSKDNPDGLDEQVWLKSVLED